MVTIPIIIKMVIPCNLNYMSIYGIYVIVQWDMCVATPIVHTSHKLYFVRCIYLYCSLRKEEGD